jgi:murein DD-endopeptidase MepM/ murein hydrolase activator NlpD
MADINSIYAMSTGGGVNESPQPSTDVATVHESAILALSPPDDDYLEQLSGKRSGVIEYVVQEGDLLSFIASDYGVSQASIIWANGLKNADSLKPGQTLRIPPVSGVVHKVVSGDTATSLAKKYGADADRIIAYNRLPKDGSLSSGDEIIVPDGKLASTPGSVTTAKSVAASQFAHLPDLGDYFLKPTTGTITRGGAIHGRNGIDIANLYGTPILAAADGFVVIADPDGYNGGYGKYVKIVHPNGTETLYAHASKLLVTVGQEVTRGMKIALMGSTGRSTGNHLHFEVHGAKNPLVK